MTLRNRWTTIGLLAGSCLVAGGCAGPALGQFGPGTAVANSGDLSPLADAEPQRERSIGYRMGRLLRGKGREDRDQAIATYREAHATFVAASEQSGEERTDGFRRAAELFGAAADRWPDSALEQEALFMRAESLFFADQLPKAEEAYGDLLQKYPRSRFLDRVTRRKFSIAHFWIEAGKVKHASLLRPNLTDHTRPMLDSRRNGLRVLDQIRFDDPTGRMAEYATMAAGIEHFEQQRYEQADQFFTDLRQTFPNSEHQFSAHLFGLKCKLEIYRGPEYARDPLDEAEELVQKLARQFPTELEEPSHRQAVTEVAAEVHYRKAERVWHQAEYRRKRGENGAARHHLQQLVKDFSDTPFAQTARQTLGEIASEPDEPPQRLAWLAEAFPDAKPERPLVTSDGMTITR